MADTAFAKRIATDLIEVIRALARQQARADFARLKLLEKTTDIRFSLELQ